MQFATLATRYAVPTVYSSRDFVEVGGLMSYGANSEDTDRQTGVYVGRILKGAKPTDLPVARASKFELVINMQTARTLGLLCPPICSQLPTRSSNESPQPYDADRRRGDLAGCGAGAQPAMPVIGFLNSGSYDQLADRVRAFLQGLAGDRLCRGPERSDRIPLGRRSLRSTACAGRRSSASPVAVIAAAGATPSGLAAKEATTTIPVIFQMGPIR